MQVEVLAHRLLGIRLDSVMIKAYMNIRLRATIAKAYRTLSYQQYTS